MTEETIKEILTMDVVTVEWPKFNGETITFRFIFPDVPNKVRTEPDHIVTSPVPINTSPREQTSDET